MFTLHEENEVKHKEKCKLAVLSHLEISTCIILVYFLKSLFSADGE